MKKLYSIFLCAFLITSYANSHPGIGIVMDSKGNVFYTDLEHVWKITPNGKRSIAVRNVHTHELYIDEQDNLYGEHEWYEGEAIDKWGNYVWCLHNNGVLQKIIPDVEGFIDNTTLLRDTEGNTYWSKRKEEHEIIIKTYSDGTDTIMSPHQFRDIHWMHYSKSNRSLYVVDHLEIKVVSPSGEVKTIADNLKEGGNSFSNVADRHYIFGLWTNKNGDLYAAVYGSGKVKKIVNNGEVSTVYESPVGWSPCGGFIAADGTMWILEFSIRNNTRVKRIRQDGSETVFGS